jgi:hypothetical protein
MMKDQLKSPAFALNDFGTKAGQPAVLCAKSPCDGGSRFGDGGTLVSLIEPESNQCSSGQNVCKDLHRNALQKNQRLSRSYSSKRLKVILFPCGWLLGGMGLILILLLIQIPRPSFISCRSTPAVLGSSGRARVAQANPQHLAHKPSREKRRLSCYGPPIM